MNAALDAHIADYLRLRRGLGFKLDRPGHELPQFARWLQAQGIETITVDAAIAWARLPEHALPIYKSQRLGAVRGFARYLRTIDPATEIPPIGLFGKQQRHAPYIYTAEEIARLLHAARQLHPPLRAATFEALLGLLAACGMWVKRLACSATTSTSPRESSRSGTPSSTATGWCHFTPASSMRCATMLAVLLDNRLKEIEAAVRAVEHPEIDRLEEIDPAYMPGHKKGVAASFEVPMGDTSAGPAGRVTSRLDGAKDGRS